MHTFNPFNPFHHTHSLTLSHTLSYTHTLPLSLSVSASVIVSVVLGKELEESVRTMYRKFVLGMAAKERSGNKHVMNAATAKHVSDCDYTCHYIDYHILYCTNKHVMNAATAKHVSVITQLIVI